MATITGNQENKRIGSHTHKHRAQASRKGNSDSNKIEKRNNNNNSNTKTLMKIRFLWRSRLNGFFSLFLLFLLCFWFFFQLKFIYLNSVINHHESQITGTVPRQTLTPVVCELMMMMVEEVEQHIVFFNHKSYRGMLMFYGDGDCSTTINPEEVGIPRVYVVFAVAHILSVWQNNLR